MANLKMSSFGKLISDRIIFSVSPLGVKISRRKNRPFSYSTKEPGSKVIFIHFIREVRESGVRASITIVDIRKFYKTLQNNIGFSSSSEEKKGLLAAI